MEKSQKKTLMQKQASLPRQVLISAVGMLLLAYVVYHFNVPNPNMILIAGLVLFSALYGYGGGTVAAVIMIGYTLFFFSTDHSFTQFAPENMQKVIVTVIGVAADLLFVCSLKTAEVRAFEQVAELSKELHSENQQLQQMSLTDALTGICNRMALRRDYDSYEGYEVAVMMLDLNDFKSINDTRGHEEGDRILRETGELLAGAFGKEHCYRYGGDEFLVIVPDISEEGFRQKLEEMTGSRPMIDDSESVGFSVGFVHAMVGDSDRLRNLIASADEKMYEKKREKQKGDLGLGKIRQPRMRTSAYTGKEMKDFLADMSEKYDLARVVDPIECRILELDDEGRVCGSESCYGIWNSEQKCLNCSSALACRTHRHQEKTERFQDHTYYIQSNPVELKLPDGSEFEAVVELVNVEEAENLGANNRDAENIGNRAAHYMAHHDNLTNVLNAEAFYELGREMVKNSPDISWVMVTGNIREFHLVNNLFGVQKGNEVLIRTAAALKEIAEAARGLCGRLGGDQFAMLLPRGTFHEVRLEDVAGDLAQIFNSGLYAFCIHFGVYAIDDPEIPVSVMCGRANAALRTIRDDMTRTVCWFDDAILEKLLQEQKVISGFEEALADGQFRMYLQPLVDKDGNVIGAEALARWIRPDGTIVSPVDFIETLENAGMIQNLDMYMWEQAVKQLSEWKDTPREDLSISVNMSAKDFYSIDVYEVLTGLLAKYGVDSSMLRLEITETALLVEPEKSDAVVARLRDAGFLVEIDDFGKGYSSLSLLKNIKADVLKIDMGFLREIRDRERSRLILKSVIDLADSLGMDVITEGVETEQQLQALSEMGCTYFQGYYFAKPMPAEEF